jgi:hypothetical protein
VRASRRTKKPWRRSRLLGRRSPRGISWRHKITRFRPRLSDSWRLARAKVSAVKASHVPMVSKPTATMKVILAAAKAAA